MEYLEAVGAPAVDFVPVRSKDSPKRTGYFTKGELSIYKLN